MSLHGTPFGDHHVPLSVTTHLAQADLVDKIGIALASGPVSNGDALTYTVDADGQLTVTPIANDSGLMTAYVFAGISKDDCKSGDMCEFVTEGPAWVNAVVGTYTVGQYVTVASLLGSSDVGLATINITNPSTKAFGITTEAKELSTVPDKVAIMILPSASWRLLVK